MTTAVTSGGEVRRRPMLVGRACLAIAIVLVACGDSRLPTSTGDPQTPPTGTTQLAAWLARGDYQAWTCETSVHDARSPGPHGANRVCSNDLVSDAIATGEAWPAGAAEVKEIYADVSGDAPVAYAVSLKLVDDSDGGAAWYWSERTLDGSGSDGTGDHGIPQSTCVACHVLAGSDGAHTPTLGGRDFIYTPVPR